jgi:glycosyltransferase involved in cell wall biosynthesis
MNTVRQLRILQVVPSLATGGAERFAVQLMTELVGRGLEVVGVSLYGRQGTPVEDLAHSNGLNVQYLGKKRGFDPRMLFRLAKVVRDFGPDLIHTHMHALRYALPAILRWRVPAVHTIHSIAEREAHLIGRWVPRLLFPKIVSPVAIAAEVQSSIRRVYGTGSVLIPNAIPVAKYRQPEVGRRDWRKSHGFEENDILFVSVARFDPVKNHSLLLRAFAGGPARYPRTHLVLAGDGTLRDQLQRMTKSMGLQGRVHFLGVTTDIPGLLGASDVFVFSSDYEGSPLSVMEGMSAGLPVIGTAVGGVPEMVPGSVGILVAPGDCHGLAEAMDVLRADGNRRANMAAAAAKHADHFDMARNARSYEALYRALTHNANRLSSQLSRTDAVQFRCS